MKIEIINQRLYIKEPPETAEGDKGVSESRVQLFRGLERADEDCFLPWSEW